MKRDHRVSIGWGGARQWGRYRWGVRGSLHRGYGLSLGLLYVEVRWEPAS